MASFITFASFYGACCHVCKTEFVETRLKRCSGCKMIAYCSSHHQKLHWPQHKKICKSIHSILVQRQQSNLYCLPIIGKSLSEEEWKRTRYNCMLLVQLSIGRTLHKDEQEMFLFPRVCEICRGYKQETLTDCKQCLCVSYCSTSHQELDKDRHDIYCSLLRLCRRMDTDNCVHVIQNGIKLSVCLITMQEHITFLPPNIELFIESYVPKNKPQVDIHNVLYSELLTWPLTLVYGIEKGMKERYETMVIHIVGAGIPECTLQNVWEVLLHWLPYLIHLKLIFIGPDVTLSTNSSTSVCADCKFKNKHLSLGYENKFYNDYFASKSFVQPNLVVAFNCGFHELESTDGDTWAKSIPYLLNFSGTCLVITSYTHTEALKDLSCIMQYIEGVAVLVKCQENPFRSLRPFRDWEHGALGVFFMNAYISVLTLVSST